MTSIAAFYQHTKKPRLTGKEFYNDVQGEKLMKPLFAPWTYPDQMIEGVINAFTVKPHFPKIVQGKDGQWRTMQGIVVKKPCLETCLNKPFASTTNSPNSTSPPQKITTTTGNGGNFIPLPEPFPVNPPPRTRIIRNGLDGEEDESMNVKVEEKIGDVMMSDNPKMTEDEYRIHISANDGNCLFDSIRQCLESIGKHVTIEQLRASVAKTVLDPTHEDGENAVLNWQTFYNEAKKANDEEMMNEYQHVSCIADEPLPLSMEAREKLYASMMTKEYWAEEYALNILEKSLNVKLLILDGDRRAALMGADHGPHFNPKYYMILVLQKQHYTPVSSKGIFCFKKHQIPLDVVQKFQKDCGRSTNHYQSLKDEIHHPSQIAPLPVL